MTATLPQQRGRALLARLEHRQCGAARDTGCWSFGYVISELQPPTWRGVGEEESTPTALGEALRVGREDNHAKSASARVLRGRSAGSPRGEARARCAPLDSKAVVTQFRSRSHRPIAVSLKKSLGQRRGVRCWFERRVRMALDTNTKTLELEPARPRRAETTKPYVSNCCVMFFGVCKHGTIAGNYLTCNYTGGQIQHWSRRWGRSARFLGLTGACQFGQGVGGFATNFIHS